MFCFVVFFPWYIVVLHTTFGFNFGIRELQPLAQYCAHAHSVTRVWKSNFFFCEVYIDPGNPGKPQCLPHISTTSRLYIGLAVCLYIGLAVCLYVFINILLFSLMFKPLYLCRERPDQESDWTDSLFSLFCACMSHILWSMNLLMNEYCHLKNCTICTHLPHFVWLY